jgi:hypothetical protein
VQRMAAAAAEQAVERVRSLHTALSRTQEEARLAAAAAATREARARSELSRVSLEHGALRTGLTPTPSPNPNPSPSPSPDPSPEPKQARCVRRSACRTSSSRPCSATVKRSRASKGPSQVRSPTRRRRWRRRRAAAARGTARHRSRSSCTRTSGRSTRRRALALALALTLALALARARARARALALTRSRSMRCAARTPSTTSGPSGRRSQASLRRCASCSVWPRCAPG